MTMTVTFNSFDEMVDFAKKPGRTGTRIRETADLCPGTRTAGGTDGPDNSSNVCPSSTCCTRTFPNSTSGSGSDSHNASAASSRSDGSYGCTDIHPHLYTG